MKYFKIQFTLNPKFRGSNDYIKDYVLHIPNDKLFKNSFINFPS